PHSRRWNKWSVPGLGDEGGGEGGPRRDELGGRAADEAAELADEMALVEVARGERGIGPVRTWVGLQHVEDAAQPQHVGEALGRQAHGVAESPLELAPAQARACHDLL